MSTMGKLGACVVWAAVAATGCAVVEREDESSQGATAYTEVHAAGLYTGADFLPEGTIRVDWSAVERVAQQGTGVTMPGHTRADLAPGEEAEWYVVASPVVAGAYHINPFVRFSPGDARGAGTFTNPGVELMGNNVRPIVSTTLESEVGVERLFYKISKGPAAERMTWREWDATLERLLRNALCSYYTHYAGEGGDLYEGGRRLYFVGYDPLPLVYGYNGNSNTFAHWLLLAAGLPNDQAPSISLPAWDRAQRETFDYRLVETPGDSRGPWGFTEQRTDVIYDVRSRVTPPSGAPYATGAFQSPLLDCAAVPARVTCPPSQGPSGPICPG